MGALLRRHSVMAALSHGLMHKLSSIGLISDKHSVRQH